MEKDGWVICDIAVCGIWTLYDEVATGSTSDGGRVLLIQILVDTVEDEETLDTMEYLAVMVSNDGGSEMVVDSVEPVGVKDCVDDDGVTS